jgi:hypothetical protein
MKTYNKLPLQTEMRTINGSVNKVEEVSVQYYEIIETTEVVEKEITTLENFVAMIADLEEKKIDFSDKTDKKIKKYQSIINELKKL